MGRCVQGRAIVLSWLIVFFLAADRAVANTSSADVKRIVSLAPSLTRNLVEMGAAGQVVGCTSYCLLADKIPVVATAVTVNLEKVLLLKPDLVVTTQLTDEAVIRQLQQVGLKVLVYSTPASFEAICSQFIDLGERTGHLAGAQQVIRRVRQRVNQLKREPTHPLKIFIQIGADPLFAVIPGTFMNDYIRLAGGINVIGEVKTGLVSREAVVQRDPDVLFIVTMGQISLQEKKRWETYSVMKAVRNHRIYFLNPDIACMASPQCFLTTLETIISLIQESENKRGNEKGI